MKQEKMNTTLNHYQTNTAQHRRITEIIIPQGQNSNTIVFSLVASLSKQPAEKAITKKSETTRWVTWITGRKPNIQQMHNMGASANILRMVHTQKTNDYRWVLWEALRTGNSHTVIADMKCLSDSDLKDMEAAAAIGKCNGIILDSAVGSAV